MDSRALYDRMHAKLSSNELFKNFSQDAVRIRVEFLISGPKLRAVQCLMQDGKMGGSGLDYYYPKMLVRLASDVSHAPAEQLRTSV